MPNTLLTTTPSQAVQLLYALSEKPRNEAVPEIALTDSEPGRVYKALRDAFRHTRKLFSAAAPILQTEELDIKELGDQETIQMANMATISASVFDADDVPLIDVHDHFLMTFLPESGTLTKELAVLFLSLKHRTLAAELVQLPDREQRGAFLERLFPANLEDQLRQLHPELPLSEHEMTFLKDMMAAKEQLLEAAKTDESRSRAFLVPPFLSLGIAVVLIVPSYRPPHRAVSFGQLPRRAERIPHRQ